MRFTRSLVVFAVAILSTSLVFAQQEPPPDSQGVAKLKKDTRGKAKIRVDKKTGEAKFVRLAPGSLPSSMINNRAAKPEARAKEFFRNYGNAFGVEKPESDLKSTGTMRDSSGSEHAMFRQTHEEIPVFGGDVRAHFDASGELFAVNGNFVSGLKVVTKPRLTAEQAAKLAISRVKRGNPAEAAVDSSVQSANREDEYLAGTESGELIVHSNSLLIFREGLLRGVPGKDHLAYEVEVRNSDVSVREFVYVDAHNGQVIDQITGIYDALDRRAFDAQGLTAPGPNYPGLPFWVEGDLLPTTDVEADNMLYASGETYDLFFNAFGFDSFDGAGATMDSIFNRGNGCPNASWNGVFISFCPGLTTDDITGHEWGHAYTQYTNNLIYQWQSGALSESYSDIWGETVDLINGRQTDLPNATRSPGGCSIYTGGVPDDSYRWLMGEDSSIGALRDMWNPNCAGDPGKVTDPEYYCLPGDQGGVHFNSGVPNHAYALMVDGGIYNGYTGPGLGLTKAAHIHWGAQNMLTATSNFVDHADALEAACSNLIGNDLNDLLTGAASGQVISGADCAEVAAIIDAVELRTPPTQCGFEPLLSPDAPALCEAQGSVQSIMFEDFEGGAAIPAGWTASSHDVANPGTFDSPGWLVVSGLPAGNSSSFGAFAPDLVEGDCGTDTEAGAVALDSPPIVLPAGKVPHVAFDHWVATEAGWDGGNVKVSVNGGAWTVVPGSAYSFNPYKATLIVSDNPLGGEEGFTATDGGSNGGSWGQSQVNLYGLAVPGDTVELRFDFGTDGCNGVVGWYVDNVHAYTCSAEELPICGDGVLDPLEMCDDGNMDDGDGCSNSCQVETGWLCGDPTPPNPDGMNLIADWSFEGGVPNADWTPFSTFGGVPGFPIYNPAGLPRTGNWLVWIGGLPTGVTSSVEQTVTIPVAATDLTLQAYRGFCSPGLADTLDVKIDGTVIGAVTCDGTDGGYVEHTFDVTAYADGAAHTLNIGGTTTGDGDTWTNFFVDDVVLNDNTPTPGTPSMCRRIVEDLACNAGVVEFDAGIAQSWSVVDNEGTGVIWTDVLTSGLGQNFTAGSGDAASVSSDAFIFTEFDTELRSNSVDLSNASSASLHYLVNYQNLAGLDFLDLDVSTDGGNSWTNMLSWNEDHPPGGLFTGPGEAVSIDLFDYLGESDVQLRWRYYDPNIGDWDWYAQVDNVELSCNLIPDCEGAVPSSDSLWPANHKWNAIEVLVTDPDGDPVTVTIDSIYQDEGVSAKGSGKTSPDGRGVGTSIAEVRAERVGKGNGRVYHIGFTADDGRGGVCSSEVLVGVPHDQGNGSTPIDDGALFDSTAP